MPIWRPTPASRQPELALIYWFIAELEDGDRHIVGLDVVDRSGRVSSAVAEIDVDAMSATTLTGRVYNLLGPSGSTVHTLYVWEAWRRGYGITAWRDVTNEVFPSAKAADQVAAFEAPPGS